LRCFWRPNDFLFTNANPTVQAFLISTAVVALAEIGDKTQLLAFVLATRFRKPVPIILAILAATLFNHAGAAAIGAWLTTLISPMAMRWVLGASFIAMAAWILVPDKLDEDDARIGRGGVFVATFVAFFLAEMGDKTQIATIALAAQYQSVFAVVAGTTLGMMLANVPAVLIGNQLAGRLPVKWVHRVAAAIFLMVGAATLLGVGERLGF
jgi:putative Ca2+/H+ antiporter (TMEM165/GDT1 family)